MTPEKEKKEQNHAQKHKDVHELGEIAKDAIIMIRERTACVEEGVAVIGLMQWLMTAGTGAALASLENEREKAGHGEGYG